MRVSQKRKDKIQAAIEVELDALRLVVVAKDIGKTVPPGDVGEFDNAIKNCVGILKALRRKYWGFTDKQILGLMKWDRGR